jgi:hypothetical protein
MILDSPFISGSMSFGIANPSATMHISASTGAVLRVDGAGVTNTGSLFVSSSGNVGIGTAIPVSKLQIEGGALRIGDGAGSWSGFTFSGGLRQTNNNPLTILGELRVDSTAGNPSYISGSGGLGIGKTTANTRLDVNGNTLISGSINATGPITGSSFTTTGTITAQTLIVQTISSSLEFVTGSTKFGSLAANTHQFTGSVGITGSLNVNNNTNAAAVINFSNNSTGNAAQTNFQLGNASGSNVSGFALFGGGFTNNGLYLADGLYMYNNRAKGGITIATEQLTDIVLATNAAERLRITSTGNVGIGTNTPTSKFFVLGAGSYGTPTSEILTSDTTIFSSEMSNNAYNSILQLVSVRQSLSTGAFSNGFLGFSTIDDSNGEGIRDAGRIAIVNESGDSRNSPTALGFWTNPGGTKTTAATEKMRITSAGNVGIGTTSPLSPFTVFKTTDAGRGGEISIVNGGTSAGTEAALNFGFGASSYNADNGNAQIKAVFTSGNEVTDMVFTSWNGSVFGEKMRITGAGNVGINTSSPGVSLQVNGIIYAQKQGGTNSTPGFQVRASGGGPRIQTYGLDADAAAWMGLGTDMAGNPYEHSLYFSNPGGGSGRQTIGSYNGTTYSVKMTVLVDGSIGAPTGTNIYNPSDLRLKKNIITITEGLNKVMGLNPVKFNWVENFSPDEQGKDMLGFIAQEVESVVPEAVEGFSDGSALIVGETTVENPLRVNEKFIIPVLVKAIQELKAEIDELKNK